MKKSDLTEYLEDFFRPSLFSDSSKNGLQVDSSRSEIRKIGFAVDASAYLIDRAIAAGVDAMIVHHGLFWGHEIPLTEILYARVSRLIRNDIALYGMHIPLDADPLIGNNSGIVRAFAAFCGISQPEIEIFGEYKGVPIGSAIRLGSPISMRKFQEFVESQSFVFDFYNFGNLSEIRSLAVVSGGAGSSAPEAFRKGYDVFLTGEGKHSDIILAKEIGQSVLFGGHYETETVGVRLLAEHLSERFGVETVFLDEKYEKFVCPISEKLV